MCDTIDGSCKNTTGCETGYLYDKYCNKSTYNSVYYTFVILFLINSPSFSRHINANQCIDTIKREDLIMRFASLPSTTY